MKSCSSDLDAGHLNVEDSVVTARENRIFFMRYSTGGLFPVWSDSVHDHCDRTIAGDIAGGADGVCGNIERDHERKLRLVETKYGF
jgi:hypothetical protein